MDNKSDKTIRFDAEGYCNYCSDILNRREHEYFPENGINDYLLPLIGRMKEECKNDEFDCLVGVSGGIDSSYILYLGHKYGLRMLAVHIDDGLDNPIATENIRKLIEATGTKLINISPDREEYADIMYSLIKASVNNLAIAQDNLILKALQDCAEEKKIKWMLDGSNFAHESILERGNLVNSCDKKYILGIQKRYGRRKIKKLQFMSLWERYIYRQWRNVKHIRPLNYMDYNVSMAIKELEAFCGFQYYGGKHYESILTRFMQCYYLPTKFGMDKRKSHFSSLIMSGQMTREQALNELEKPLYSDATDLERDKEFLANYMGISVQELERCINQAPVDEMKFKHSILNEFAPIARKFRRFLE